MSIFCYEDGEMVLVFTEFAGYPQILHHCIYYKNRLGHLCIPPSGIGHFIIPPLEENKGIVFSAAVGENR